MATHRLLPASLAIASSLGLAGCFSPDGLGEADESSGGAESDDTGTGGADASDHSGAADDDGPTPGDDADASDDGAAVPEPPTILDVSPADGSTGVAEDAVIIVTFSEPMDKASTQVAYQSTDIPDVTFSWNDAGDELTITPNEMLPYAEGEDPEATEANAFAISISNAAESEAGLALADPLELSFSTLRRLAHSLEHDEFMSGRLTLAGNKAPSGFVGDFADDDYGRYFLTFDTLGMAPGVAAVEAATLHASRALAIQGNPYGDLGQLQLQRVSYASFNGATFGIAGIGSMSAFFAGAGDFFVDRDVADHVVDVLADPATYGDRLQFRILWQDDETDGDGAPDGLTLVPGNFRLDLTYLAP